MTAFVRGWVAARTDEDTVNSYYAAGPFEGNHGGLARYWQQVAEGKLSA